MEAMYRRYICLSTTNVSPISYVYLYNIVFDLNCDNVTKVCVCVCARYSTVRCLYFLVGLFLISCWKNQNENDTRFTRLYNSPLTHDRVGFRVTTLISVWSYFPMTISFACLINRSYRNLVI